MTNELPLQSDRAPMRLLIFGSDGVLGAKLAQRAPLLGVDIVGAGLTVEDICRKEKIAQLFADAGQVSAVINAAFYLTVDEAEANPDMAFAVHRDGAALLARACRERALPLIHLSSDYVFDGLKTTAYQPLDPVGPLSVFGCSQAEGETAVREQLERHLIVRSAWLFGHDGACFVKQVIRQALEQEELRVADDQVGCPTYAGDLAGALLKAAVRAGHKEAVWGTYHFCNEGAVTWYAFARRIIALAKSRTQLAVRRILPVLSSYEPRAVRRPPCAILDCSTFEQTFAVHRRPWSDALRDMLRELFP